MLETRQKEKIEAAKQQHSKSLQHSNYILEQSNSRIIDEMYRLLVEAQKDRDNSCKYMAIITAHKEKKINLLTQLSFDSLFCSW